MVTLENIRQILDKEHLEIDSSNIIESGQLIAHNSTNVRYEVLASPDMKIARMCEAYWGGYNEKLLFFIQESIKKGADKHELLSRTQFGDAHWEWLKKVICYINDDHYHWFFVLAEEKPQAACVIYQPKASIISPSSNIFYIEYIATAPWNRDNPMESRRFFGVGSLIISAACRYAINNLGLNSGFSLHSLPGAIGYYKKIGMSHLPEHSKDGLAFFEKIDASERS